LAPLYRVQKRDISADITVRSISDGIGPVTSTGRLLLIARDPRRVRA